VLTKELISILEKREFLSVATCGLNNRPNAAPKFLLKVDEEHIYLVDYTIGTTWQNLKVNPRLSLSFMDQNTLKGYQINGDVQIIDKGPAYKKMHKEMMDKEVHLTTKHIIEDVRGEGRHDNYEVIIREKFVIFEMKIDEVVEIGVRGELKRRRAKIKTV
jgi:uncharacterized pyridoxamine 5'-phosphate oxidase family protein